MRTQTPTANVVDDALLSDAVVFAVAEANGVDPLDLDECLYDVVDPDALTALIESASSNARVSFRFAGCRVTVRGDGRVTVEGVRGSQTRVPVLAD